MNGQNGRDGRNGQNGTNGISVDLQKCGRHDSDITNLQESDKRQWDLIQKIQNRLPVWATFVFGILTLIIGWLLASGFHRIMKGN
ncbi:MAG: hypothetical protein WC356_02695 [Candidatus Micrarchaeia archaeon]|jgi:hypothetical protein